VRFAVAHKAATYLMVGFAYLAMVLGGAVQPMIALGGLIGLVGSWWWEPPTIRFERWAWMWTVASVFALVYSVLTAVVTGDFLGVGAQFLIWLVVAKAYNRRAARDWQQIYLLAFLMLVAGSVLNADLTYGLCFLGFVITATWAMTLFHLRREMEDNLLVKHAADRASERVEVRRILDSKRIVGRRFFVGTGVLSFGVFLIASIVFLAIPRVGFGFFLKNRGGLTLAGFSDGVKLGGHGVIKHDSTIVMRVEIDARHGGRDRPELHWRGVAFDEYSKGQWRRSLAAPRTNSYRLDPRPGIERHTIQWRDAPPVSLDTAVKQNIWLEPLDSDVLFGASNPRAYELAQIMRKRKPTVPRNDEFRIEHGSTLHYTVWSDLERPPIEKLRGASEKVPVGYFVYLQLPEEITAETRELAARITAGLTNNYDKAVAIERWLETNLTYTLQLRDPGRTEPVHFFLFERQQGHCEYFASAFAVLARASGIPTRQVNGFLGGEWNEYQGYVAVRAGDAHSWAEVFFPGVGWVTFDPTPSASGGLGRGGSGWRAKLGRYVDTLRFQWSKWVIEYDLVAQLSLVKDVGRAFKRAAAGLRDVMATLMSYWPLAAGGTALVALVLALRRRRVRDMLSGGPRRGQRRTRSAIAQAYDQAVRQLAKAGTPRDLATTPRELATGLAARGAPVADELGELTDLYYASEWGGRRDPAAEQRAGELATAIARRLRDARSS
jgi:protein-glutamine gamma-glutamyltransferase